MEHFSVLGLDTSNYTTSCAVYTEKGLEHEKRLLPVRTGQLGLRQSDAVFHHIRALPEVSGRLLREHAPFTAIGVSDRPRDQEDSYMPCFAVGESAGKMLAEAMKVPLYRFSHQAGHVVAVLYSAGRLDLLRERFLAFHVSGGTTEAVLVEPDETSILKTELVASSMDLKAGQAIDRCGVMMGLAFPCGSELEKLADKWQGSVDFRPSMQGVNSSFSGIENKCKKMMEDGEPKEKIAFFCMEAVRLSLDGMCSALLHRYGKIPVVFGGGVSSNKMIRSYFSRQYDACFGEPAMSSDNAAGVAVLAAQAFQRGVRPWNK